MTPGTGPEPDAAAELGVLFPDVEIAVGDPDTGALVDLVVREFRFREGLELQALARPLVEALAAAAESGLEVAAIEDAMAAHADLWLDLVGRACGRDPEWLGRLGDTDAHALSNAMWSANGGFFVRRAAALVARRRDESRSRGSSTASSAPATDSDTTT